MSMRRRRQVTNKSVAIALFIATAVLCLSPTGTSASTRPAASKMTLTLYNGQHVLTTDSLITGFEKAYPNISVAVRSNDEDTLADEISAEGGRSPADVIYTENSPALEYLQQHGLLAPVNASTLAKSPSKFDSSQGDWVGVSARVSVLIYNPGLIKRADLPTGVLQLAASKYAGKIALAPGETDFQPIVTAVLRSYGKAATLKWLDGLKSNAQGHIYADNETIADEVNRGAVAFGIVNQYYWYRMRAEIGASNIHSLITYFAPHNPGYVIDVSGAGILKSSTHRAAAQDFLAYLVSKAGQEIIAHSLSFEYPIASGVRTAQQETPFSKLSPYPINITQLGTGATAIALMREVQLL